MNQSRCATATASPRSLDRFANGITSVENAATQTGKAWCGSWLGSIPVSTMTNSSLHHLAHGSIQRWDLCDRTQSRTVGDWAEYSFEGHLQRPQIRRGQRRIRRISKSCANACRQEVLEHRETLLSILNTIAANGEDRYLDRLLADADKAKPVSASQFVRYYCPSGTFHSLDIARNHQRATNAAAHPRFSANSRAIDSPFSTAKRNRRYRPSSYRAF